jgi:hypothetical protein
MSSRRIKASVSLAIPSLISTTAFLVPAMASQPTTRCWVFQTTNRLIGNYKIYASSRAVKVVDRNNKWMESATAPGWDVYIFNPKSKLYYRWKQANWRGHPILNMASRVSRDKQTIKTKERMKICGLTTTKYLAVTSSDAIRGEGSDTQIWVANDVSLPKQVIHVECGNTTIPDTEGFPLRVVAERKSEGTMVVADTISAQQVDVPDKFFEKPPDCKLARTPEDVLMGGTVKDIIEDLVR